MTDRNTRILKAAESVFARYGVGKTTMNDIAREAGVARQTLYNSYPGKDEVVRAVVQNSFEQTFRQVSDAWQTAPTLEDKLDRFFELGPLAWYDAVESSPDAAEFLDGVHIVAKEEMERAGRRGTEAFSAMLRDYAPGLADAPGGIDAIAEFIYSTAINAKKNAANRQVLEQRLAVLKASVLAMVAAAAR
ncbi:MAG: TetR/AcrR family transcriptional regulator [Phyllobacteriaceae bacterium]|nr:TetR/AcrR family transcriptional regulator [Phyllobacteriaceae bacterium]